MIDWFQIIGTGAGAVAAMSVPVTLINNKRKSDQDFVTEKVTLLDAKLTNDISDIESAMLHARGNHKALDQACTSKFDAHTADLIRLTENQRQTTTTVGELKAEMRLGFAEIKHDREKSDAAFMALLKSESERSRESINSLSELLKEYRSNTKS